MPSLNEDIDRIKSIMGLILEERYTPCEIFIGNSLEVCKSFNSLQSWISSYKGLDLRKDIETYLNELYTNIPQEDLDKFMKGVEFIKQTGKYSDGDIEKKVERIKNSKLIYVDGEWHYANKLNTNYSDSSELLTTIIEKMGKMDEVYNWLIKDPNPERVKNFLLKSIKPNISKFLNTFFKDKIEILQFTRNTKYNTEIGEEAERRIESLLEKNGFNILYRGGNGDLVDMIFGADIIAERFDKGIVLIQVKSSGPKWENLGDYKVDWIGIGNGKIYDKNTRKEINITNYSK
jgi:hypothetical protein